MKFDKRLRKLKLAWITNTLPSSLSTLYLERLLPIFLKSHENYIFSNSQVENDNGFAGSYHGMPVSSYLTFNPTQYDLVFFLLEDNIESSFVYDFSILFPGIRIFLDNTFNNLKFKKYSHYSNGIVYEQMLINEGFNKAIKIGQYHMRGWSLEPYHRLYPLYFSPVNHGLNIITRPCFKSSSETDYVPFPITGRNFTNTNSRFDNKNIERDSFEIIIFADSELYDRPNLAEEVIEEINITGGKIKLSKYIDHIDLTAAKFGLVLRTENQRGLPSGAIQAIESGMPIVFLSHAKTEDYWGQLVIAPGLAEKEKLKAIIKILVEEPLLLSSLKNVLSDNIEQCSAEYIYQQLMELVSTNLNEITQQMKDCIARGLRLQSEVVRSALDERVEFDLNGKNLSSEFISRFALSV